MNVLGRRKMWDKKKCDLKSSDSRDLQMQI